jgi:hypothetical protein
MSTIQLLASALGLGFIAGIRLYTTVLVLGLGIRFGLLHPRPEMAGLSALANPYVLAVGGAAWLLEFLADKVPWIDSIWDTVHTVIRPVGAVWVAAAATGHMDAVTSLIVILLSGGIALTSHSGKAATRLAVNHSPEPFSNMALSFAEDLSAPLGLWLAIRHPYVMAGIVAACVAVFCWLAPKIFRLVRIEFAALAALFRRLIAPPPARLALPPVYVSRMADALAKLEDRLVPAPPEYAARFTGGPAPASLYCAATGRAGGLRNSIGYLCFTGTALVFVTRRMFRFRVFEIQAGSITGARLARGLLLDRLTVEATSGALELDVFPAGR